MEISRPISLFSVVICSWVFVGFSQDAGGGIGDLPPCMPKLLPCQPYLKGASPPPSCCLPLKEIIADDPQCLCAVFNNPSILKSFNITLDDAMNLAKSCGADADISVCKKAAAPTGSSPSPSNSPDSNGSTENTPAPGKHKGAANGRLISHIGLSVVMSITAVSSFFIVSAF